MDDIKNKRLDLKSSASGIGSGRLVYEYFKLTVLVHADRCKKFIVRIIFANSALRVNVSSQEKLDKIKLVLKRRARREKNRDNQLFFIL